MIFEATAPTIRPAPDLISSCALAMKIIPERYSVEECSTT
jgi:hypothetical protein